ncbi:MAG: hypothetical protein J7515_12480 [Caulobacter sp.]|nr:hypothetical protein [Caulobacter sp.]
MRALILAAAACAGLTCGAERSWAEVGAENAGFESPFDTADKAKTACGLTAIEYRGIDKDWTPPSRTTPALIFSRDLMAWCRAYGPISKGGGRLTVTFSGVDALARNIETELADEDGAVVRRFGYYELLGFSQFAETAYDGPSFLLQASHDLVAQGRPRRTARDLYRVLCAQPWERPFGALLPADWSEPGSVLRARSISLFGFDQEAAPPLTEGGGYRPGIATFRRAGMVAGWRGRTDADRQFVSTTVSQTFVFSQAPCAPAVEAEVAPMSPYDPEVNARVAKTYPTSAQSRDFLAGLAEIAAPRSVCERTIIGSDGARFNVTGSSSSVVSLPRGSLVVGQTFLHRIDGRHFLSTAITLDTHGDRPDARCDTAIFS